MICRHSTSSSLDVLFAGLEILVSESRKSLSGRTSLVIIVGSMLRVENGFVQNRKIAVRWWRIVMAMVGLVELR